MDVSILDVVDPAFPSSASPPSTSRGNSQQPTLRGGAPQRPRVESAKAQRSPADSIIALQRTAGNRAIARSVAVLQRQPTFGNLFPDDAPIRGAEVVRLELVDNKWKEIGPRFSRTARGTYDFVVRDGRLYAVKAKRTMGAAGHTEAAQGQRVAFAGQVQFEAGILKGWNDGSGHFRPASAGPAEAFRKAAIDAGLNGDAFDHHPDTLKRPRPTGAKGPQLPVEQPTTRPRTPGEPAQIGPGPPRLDELERQNGLPRSAPTSPVEAAAPTPPVEAAAPRPVAVPSGAGSTAPELAAELSDKVAFTRRMTFATQALHWGLEAWKIYELVVLMAQMAQMATSTLANQSPYRQAIDEARSVAEKARETQHYYNALNLVSSMPSQENAPIDWDSAYTLYQDQLNFLLIERELSDARQSVQGAIEELEHRRKQLKDGMEEREQALLLPVTSAVYAEAILFASAGGQINERIDEAIASYQDTDKAIHSQQLFARAAAKVLEMRLRTLGSAGRFESVPGAALRGSPLSTFTLPR
jgi:hypothetical protein